MILTGIPIYFLQTHLNVNLQKSKKKQKSEEASGSASNLLMEDDGSPEHAPIANGLPQSPEQGKTEQEKVAVTALQARDLYKIEALLEVLACIIG